MLPFSCPPGVLTPALFVLVLPSKQRRKQPDFISQAQKKFEADSCVEFADFFLPAVYSRARQGAERFRLRAIVGYASRCTFTRTPLHVNNSGVTRAKPCSSLMLHPCRPTNRCHYERVVSPDVEGLLKFVASAQFKVSPSHSTDPRLCCRVLSHCCTACHHKHFDASDTDSIRPLPRALKEFLQRVTTCDMDNESGAGSTFVEARRFQQGQYTVADSAAFNARSFPFLDAGLFLMKEESRDAWMSAECGYTCYTAPEGDIFTVDPCSNWFWVCLCDPGVKGFVKRISARVRVVLLRRVQACRLVINCGAMSSCRP